MNETKRMSWAEMMEFQRKLHIEDRIREQEVFRKIANGEMKSEIIRLSEKRNPFPPELVNRR